MGGGGGGEVGAGGGWGGVKGRGASVVAKVGCGEEPLSLCVREGRERSGAVRGGSGRKSKTQFSFCPVLRGNLVSCGIKFRVLTSNGVKD